MEPSNKDATNKENFEILMYYCMASTLITWVSLRQKLARKEYKKQTMIIGIFRSKQKMITSSSKSNMFSNDNINIWTNCGGSPHRSINVFSLGSSYQEFPENTRNHWILSNWGRMSPSYEHTDQLCSICSRGWVWSTIKKGPIALNVQFYYFLRISLVESLRDFIWPTHRSSADFQDAVINNILSIILLIILL